MIEYLRVRCFVAVLSLAGLVVFGNSSAWSQVSCPDQTNQATIGNNANGQCNANSGAGPFPQNGFGLFASTTECNLLQPGRLQLGGFDNGSFENPSSIICPNCNLIQINTIAVAPGTTSVFTATFNVNGNTTNITLTGQYSRSADGLACSVTNVTASGGNFINSTTNISQKGLLSSVAGVSQALTTLKNQNWSTRTQVQNRLFDTNNDENGLSLAFKGSNSRPGENIFHSSEIKRTMSKRFVRHQREKERSINNVIFGEKKLEVTSSPDISSTLKSEKPFDFWASGGYTKVDSSVPGFSFDSDLYHAQAGVDYKLSERLLAGIFVGLNEGHADFSDVAATKLDSTAYSIGMYFGWRTNSKMGLPFISDIIIDGSFAYGFSDYDIQDVTGNGSFDADRWFYNLNVTSVIKYHLFGLPIRSLPRIGVRYVSEDQDAFTDSSGLFVGARENSIGQLFYGSETFITISPQVEAYIRTETAWDFKEADEVSLTDGSIFKRDDFGSTIGGGLQIMPMPGINLRIEGAAEDIGRDDFESYSGKGRVNLQF